MDRKINYRNLAIQAAVSLPIGIALGYFALTTIGIWWALAIGIPVGLLSGIIVATLGFRIRA